jgi:threonine/homoserine/homoserine lactone efflux protein
MVVTCTAAILLFGEAATSAQKGTGLATDILQLVFGTLLLAMGTYRLRQRHKGVAPKQPRLLRSIENIKPAGAIGFGLAMIVVNPKNLMLLLSALMQIGKSQPSTATAVICVAIFICIASVGVLIPLFIYAVFRKKAMAILGSWNTWLAAHSSTVTMYLFLLLGVFLLVKGIVGLAS